MVPEELGTYGVPLGIVLAGTTGLVKGQTAGTCMETVVAIILS
jgi:hypothetical protein